MGAPKLATARWFIVAGVCFGLLAFAWKARTAGQESAVEPHGSSPEDVSQASPSLSKPTVEVAPARRQKPAAPYPSGDRLEERAGGEERVASLSSEEPWITVHDDEGVGVPGAEVLWATQLDGPFQSIGLTKADGSLALTPAEWEGPKHVLFEARAAGYAKVRVEVEVDSRPVQIETWRLVACVVEVHDPEGNPVPYPWAREQDPERFTVLRHSPLDAHRGEAGGRIPISLPAAKTAVRVGAKGFISRNIVVEASVGGTPVFTVVLRPGAELSVRVIDERGSPIQGAQVSVFDSGMRYDAEAYGETGPDGRVELAEVDPRVERPMVLAQHPGYRLARRRLEESWMELESVEVVLDDAATLEVQVRDAHGRMPTARVQVFTPGTGSPWRETPGLGLSSTYEGKASFRSLPVDEDLAVRVRIGHFFAYWEPGIFLQSGESAVIHVVTPPIARVGVEFRDEEGDLISGRLLVRGKPLAEGATPREEEVLMNWRPVRTEETRYLPHGTYSLEAIYCDRREERTLSIEGDTSIQFGPR